MKSGSKKVVRTTDFDEIPVVPRVRGTFSQRHPVEVGDIEPMHRRDAIISVTHMQTHLFCVEVDKSGG